jgi:ubiquinol-cytochrome c reductase cytochrome c subunit
MSAGQLWVMSMVWIVSAAASAPRTTAPQTSQLAAPPSSQAAAPPGDAEKGKALFVRNGCYQCHNYEGQGGSAGARLAPNPLPFRGFLAYVRAPRGEMPPYTAKVMTDQDLADVHAFLRSRPRPPALTSIPLLSR